MVRHAPISFKVRKHPMHILVTGSTLHTLMQGEATSASSVGWGSGAVVSDIVTQVMGPGGSFKKVEERVWLVDDSGGGAERTRHDRSV